ncbi:serpin-like protein, partial [Lasius niger]
TQSLFLLFPAVQSIFPNNWEVDKIVSGLVERLTTNEETDVLRKVLDNQESSTAKLSTESEMYPDFFELENELPIDQLLVDLTIRELSEPDNASLPNFTDENMHFGGAMHRA